MSAKRAQLPAVKNESKTDTKFKLGNPGGGRAKGSRNRLGEQFIQDLYADWHAYGIKVLAKVREDRPHEYLKVVASILPKQLDVQISEYERHTDDELRAELLKDIAELGIEPDPGTTAH